jgi:4-phospho-D-threonate 3-dehydrogenase / 4-phospho-D-erythronate 3-dehydrogenase
MQTKPIIAISLGDVAGIGPEICAKALGHRKVYNVCKPLIIGDSNIMQKACKLTGVKLRINTITQIQSAIYKHGMIDVMNIGSINMSKFKYGKVDAKAGKASGDYLIKAVRLALAKQVNAIVTCPINKEALHAGGYRYAGHTEFLAHLTHTKTYAMLLVNDSFRVAHISTHCSLKEACRRVKKLRILHVIRLLHDTLKKLHITSPRIGVAALNPHAGEHGLFGNEEEKEITPAIKRARKEGINAEGPFPPDTIFTKLKAKFFDGVVAMYHDQGHIPSKLLGIKIDARTGEYRDIKGVNMTIGLPIIRVSVEHGTAYDKAGKGVANPKSLLEAIEFAANLAT